jgi:hypothetical protein
MKPNAIQVHRSWLLPALLVSLPLSMYFFVGRPLLKKEKQDS